MYFDYLFLLTSFIIIFCTVVYLLAYQQRRESNGTDSEKWPGVSIIVPVWNEEMTIQKTLNALDEIKRAYHGEMEIIVIDDYSTDNSHEIISENTKKCNYIRLYLKETKKGKSESLNQGIALARYELVGCVDADSYPLPDAMNHVVREFDDPDVGAVTTKLVVNKPNNLVEWFQQIEYMYSNFILMAFDSIDSIFITRGPLSIYRKDVLQKIGGFLPAAMTPTEDMEITFRIRKAGFTIKGCRQAKVYTSVMATWKQLFWQRIRWNRGTLINFWMHRDMLLDSRFGMFSMFVMPTSTLMISMVGLIIIYMVYKIISFLTTQIIGLYWIVKSGNYTDLLDILYSIGSYSFFSAPYHVLLVLTIIILFFLVNGFGLIESRERLGMKYLLVLMLTPFIYNPAMIVFWFSAIVLQTTKYSLRWR
jgi:cellulose synthase/poly-beta-1,6-N-acetylglucosamine synthase-like glycosyltransferase